MSKDNGRGGEREREIRCEEKKLDNLDVTTMAAQNGESTAGVLIDGRRR